MRFLVDRQSVNCGLVDAEVSGDTNGSADQILSREAAMIGKGGTPQVVDRLSRANLGSLRKPEEIAGVIPVILSALPLPL
jgi:hypothetical protein